jgi:NAD-dependent protein deacetylase/lipoamidase
VSESRLFQARRVLQGARRVAVFSGAGLSAESGIATFRDQETDALWSRFDPTELASVEGFAKNPSRVIDWYSWRRQKLARVAPNPAHTALAAHPGLVHITQNVDDLLERAGVREERIHRLHGSIIRDRCHAGCGYEETVDLAQPPPLRDCPRCRARLRPAVVWFGEGLPEPAFRHAGRLCAEVDCLLVVGTSGSVYPAAGLVGLARARGASLVVVNTQPSHHSSGAEVECIGRAGEILPRLVEGMSLTS